MAPPPAESLPTSKRPISTIAMIMAMQTEALPLIHKFHLSLALDSVFPVGVPWVRYHGTYKGLYINIVLPGKHPVLVKKKEKERKKKKKGRRRRRREEEEEQKKGRRTEERRKKGSLPEVKSFAGASPAVSSSELGIDGIDSPLLRVFDRVDNVGTVCASLITYASIQALQPDLIINAGTAGGFKAKGACIGDVYLVSDVAFHDRRIPIPVFDLYGVGQRQAFATPNMSKDINLKAGKLSTGDSMDMCPIDESSIIANDATLKDMEGAAVAYVADLLKVPAIFMKAVTDIVDGDKPTSEEYLENLSGVTAALGQAVSQVIYYIEGKCVSEL